MKAILDACCGGKMMYFDKHDPRILSQDIRTVPRHKIESNGSYELGKQAGREECEQENKKEAASALIVRFAEAGRMITGRAQAWN